MHDARRWIRRLARLWREYDQPRGPFGQSIQALADDDRARAMPTNPALKLSIRQDDGPRAGRAGGGLARGDDGGEREGAALVAQSLRLFKNVGLGHGGLFSSHVAGE